MFNQVIYRAFWKGKNNYEFEPVAGFTDYIDAGRYFKTLRKEEIKKNGAFKIFIKDIAEDKIWQECERDFDDITIIVEEVQSELATCET